MVGIFGYMVFEMLFIGKVIKEIDVYSFGVLMFEVVCGKKFVDFYLNDFDMEFQDVVLLYKVWCVYEVGDILVVVDF